MVKASSAPATQLTSSAQRQDRADGEHRAEGERLVGRDAAARDGPARGALHARVDVGVVPHVEGAGGARADGDADQRDDGERGMRCCPGASTMPTSAVNTTSDITRGFISATKSPMLPPAAWAERSALA